MNTIRKHKSLLFLVLVFGIIYSLISLVNHYNFRTYALDLGAYTNAMYDYIHFKWNDSGVFKAEPENLLADHFDLYLMIFSPASLVLGTYTLLIVQILFLLFGGCGVYKYFNDDNANRSSVALYAAMYFYLFFGVFSAVSCDYHSNVVAASIVPWFFHTVRKEQLKSASLLFILILISKENISLWMMFICLGLAMEFRKRVHLKKYLLGASLLSGTYFLIITILVMPSLSNSHTYQHFNYSFLGNSYQDAFIHLINNPVESFKALFINHTGHPDGESVKIELHIFLMISGFLFLIKKPQYIFMLLPIFFQKLYHDNHNMWGIGFQYSIEFAPIMAIGVFEVISEWKPEKRIRHLSVITLVLTGSATVRLMDSTALYTNKSNIRFYQSSHYTRDYNVKMVHQRLSELPENAVVSAQSAFLPHLALRDRIYQLPIIKEAGYIIYSEKEGSYPLKESELDSMTNQLIHSGEWRIIYNKDIKILKKTP